jgi:hypothetical protein
MRAEVIGQDDRVKETGFDQGAPRVRVGFISTGRRKQ